MKYSENKLIKTVLRKHLVHNTARKSAGFEKLSENELCLQIAKEVVMANPTRFFQNFPASRLYEENITRFLTEDIKPPRTVQQIAQTLVEKAYPNKYLRMTNVQEIVNSGKKSDELTARIVQIMKTF